MGSGPAKHCGICRGGVYSGRPSPHTIAGETKLLDRENTLGHGRMQRAGMEDRKGPREKRINRRGEGPRGWAEGKRMHERRNGSREQGSLLRSTIDCVPNHATQNSLAVWMNETYPPPRRPHRRRPCVRCYPARSEPELQGAVHLLNFTATTSSKMVGG